MGVLSIVQPWLQRWCGAIAALACIATHTVLVGAGACVVCAALMGVLNTLDVAALVCVSAGDHQWRLHPETLPALPD